MTGHTSTFIKPASHHCMKFVLYANINRDHPKCTPPIHLKYNSQRRITHTHHYIKSYSNKKNEVEIYFNILDYLLLLSRFVSNSSGTA